MEIWYIVPYQLGENSRLDLVAGFLLGLGLFLTVSKVLFGCGKARNKQLHLKKKRESRISFMESYLAENK